MKLRDFILQECRKPNYVGEVTCKIVYDDVYQPYLELVIGQQRVRMAVTGHFERRFGHKAAVYVVDEQGVRAKA